MTNVFDWNSRPSGASITSDNATHSVQPWGVRSMRPYKVATSYSPRLVPARMELDPVTQVTVYYDDEGRVIEMDRHRKSYEGTEKSTPTGTQGDGKDPNPDDTHTQAADEVD